MSAPLQEKAERNQTVDLLRCIGLFLVIAAHCSFPGWFYEFREFDVVLLFAVSGMSCILSGKGKSSVSYKSYVIHRFRRLVLPVWCFLAAFFVLFELLGHGFSLSVITKSFLLLSGGLLFVWVFRVFFTTSLFNPLLAKWSGEVQPLIGSVILLVGILANDGITAAIRLLVPSAAYKVFEVLITYTIAYALVAFAGMLYIRANRKLRIQMTALFAAAFVLAWIFFRFAPVSEFKYPPAFCYCTYGLFACTLLYSLLEKVHLPMNAAQCADWLSCQSLNIYMWHILIYYLADTFFPAVIGSGIVEYSLFLGGGILFAAGAQLIREKIGKRTI